MKYYASFPPPNLERNPFMVLLEKALKRSGWVQFSFNFKTYNLFRYKNKVSLLYFHWPESIWRSPNIVIGIFKAILFIIKLKVAQLLNYKIVWSVHNIMPHHFRNESLEVHMREFMIKNSDLLVFHALNTEQELNEKFPGMSFRSVTGIHGHYEDLYEPAGKTDRKTLGIPVGAKVFLLLAKNRGKDAEYCFISHWIRRSYENSYLLISGSLSSEEERRILELPRIIYQKGFQSRAALGDLIALSDILVLPYDRITTSGLFFLAVTFGKPVFAPDLNFFRMHIAKNGGVLYESTEEIGDAIEKAIYSTYDESSILEQKGAFNWNESALTIAKAFNGITC